MHFRDPWIDKPKPDSFYKHLHLESQSIQSPALAVDRRFLALFVHAHNTSNVTNRSLVIIHTWIIVSVDFVRSHAVEVNEPVDNGDRILSHPMSYMFADTHSRDDLYIAISRLYLSRFPKHIASFNSLPIPFIYIIGVEWHIFARPFVVVVWLLILHSLTFLPYDSVRSICGTLKRNSISILVERAMNYW